MVLYITTNVDNFGRRVYLDQKNKEYVDVNINDNNPYIHTITKDGEPNYPVNVTEIKPCWVNNLYRRCSIALAQLNFLQYSKEKEEEIESHLIGEIKECERLSELLK